MVLLWLSRRLVKVSICCCCSIVVVVVVALPCQLLVEQNLERKKYIYIYIVVNHKDTKSMPDAIVIVLFAVLIPAIGRVQLEC